MKDQIDSPLSILLSEMLLLDNRIKRPPLTHNALLSKVHTYVCGREGESGIFARIKHMQFGHKRK